LGTVTSQATRDNSNINNGNARKSHSTYGVNFAVVSCLLFFSFFLKGFFPALALGAAEIRFEIPKFKFKCTSAPNRIASNRTDCDVKWPGSHGI